MSRAYGNATACLRGYRRDELVKDAKWFLVALSILLLVGTHLIGPQQLGNQFNLFFSSTSTWSADDALPTESFIWLVIESVAFLLFVSAGVWTWTYEWAGSCLLVFFGVAGIDGQISDHVRLCDGEHFVNGQKTMSIIPFINTAVILLGMKLSSELLNFAFDETRFWPMIRSVMFLLMTFACVWMRMHKWSDSRSDVPISDLVGRSSDQRSASRVNRTKTKSAYLYFIIIAVSLLGIAALVRQDIVKSASLSCDKFGCANLQSGFGLSVSEIGSSTAISGVESSCASMDHNFLGIGCSSCDEFCHHKCLCSTCSMISGAETSPPQVSNNNTDSLFWIQFADNHFRIDSLLCIGRHIIVRSCEDVAEKFETTKGNNGACVQWKSFFAICRNFLKRPLRLLLHRCMIPIVAMNFVRNVGPVELGGHALGLLVPIAIVVVNEMIDWCCTRPPNSTQTFGKPRMLEPAYRRDVSIMERRLGRLKNKRSLPREYKSVYPKPHMSLLCQRIAADFASAFVGYEFSTIFDSRFLLIALCSFRVAYGMITRGHSRGLLESAKFLIPAILFVCPGLLSSTEAQMCMQYLSGVVMVDAAMFLWVNFRFIVFWSKVVSYISLIYCYNASMAMNKVFRNFLVDISGKSWSAESLLAACLSVFWNHLAALPEILRGWSRKMLLDTESLPAECLSLVAVVSVCFGLIICLVLCAFRSSDEDAVASNGPRHSSRQKRCLADETRNLEQAKLDGVQSCQGAYSGALPRVIYSSSAGVGYSEPTAEADQAAADPAPVPGHTAVLVEEIPSIEEHQAQSCPQYRKGTFVWYRDSTGAVQRARILASHQDDSLEPYYSIRLPDGREKQTDNAHIRLSVEEFDTKEAPRWSDADSIDAHRNGKIVNEETTGGMVTAGWALIMSCAVWNPIVFGLTFMAATMLLKLCTGAGLIKGGRGPYWSETAMAFSWLFVGVESAGGVGGGLSRCAYWRSPLCGWKRHHCCRRIERGRGHSKQAETSGSGLHVTARRRRTFRRRYSQSRG